MGDLDDVAHTRVGAERPSAGRQHGDAASPKFPPAPGIAPVVGRYLVTLDTSVIALSSSRLSKQRLAAPQPHRCKHSQRQKRPPLKE
jgi:hypothetical protein